MRSDPAPAPKAPRPARHAGLRRYTDAYDAQCEVPGTRLGVCARVLRVEQMRSRAYPGHFRVLFEDSDGTLRFYTRPLRDRRVYRRARESLRQGHLVVAFGSFPTPGDREPESLCGCMALESLRRLTRPTSLLGPDAGELAAIDALLDRLLEAPGALRAFLLGECRDLCGVAAEALSPRFEMAEEMMLLQALSHAQVRAGLNSRLSIYLCSNPGAGKNTVADYALLLAPLAEQVQPTTTGVGLSARTRLTPRAWEAEPGVLPRFSGGAVVIDDLHRLDPRDMNKVQGVLMSALEQGKVRTHKAGSASFDARVAVVLTSNRRSLRGDAPTATPVQRAADLVVPYDLLSRIDLMLNLGSGDDAVRSAMAIAAQPACPEHPDEEDEDLEEPEGPSEREVRERRLRLLVARLKERFAVVDLSAVEEAIQTEVLKVGVVLREYTARLPMTEEENFGADGLMRRIANTLRKLVGAQARLCGRAVGTQEDLDRAWALINPKLEVIRWIAGDSDRIRPLPDREAQVAAALKASKERWARMLLGFGGQRQMAEMLARVMGCSERMIVRELGKRGLEPREGWYELPTVEADEEAQRKRAAAGEEGKLADELVKPPPDGAPAAAPPAPPAAPNPRRARFDERVPVVPERLLPVLALLTALRNTADVQNLMMELVLDEQRGRYRASVSGIRTELLEALERTGYDLDPRRVQELFEWLAVDDWVERGKRVVAVYAASDLEDDTGPLRRIQGMHADWGTVTHPVLLSVLESLYGWLDGLRRAFFAEAMRKVQEDLERARAAPQPKPFWES